VDIREEIAGRLATAQAEAARLVTEAHATAERIRREAYQEGLQAGRSTAQQQLREELEGRLATAWPALHAAAAGLERERTQALKQFERDVVRLAVGIAGRLVRRELRTSPEIPLTLIREALELAASCSRLAVHLSPADCDTLREPLAQLTTSHNGTRAIQIVPDPAIASGGCLVHTEFGVIDQQIETQLERIEKELL
jgi:flagellar assembly protein FliH